jgi:positive regulator of sigma E activity
MVFTENAVLLNMPIILLVVGSIFGMDLCARFFSKDELFLILAALLGGYFGFESGRSISRFFAGKDIYGRDNYKD